LVTVEPIGFFASGNIPIGHVVVLGYLFGVWDNPNPPTKKAKNPSSKSEAFL